MENTQQALMDAMKQKRKEVAKFLEQKGIPIEPITNTPEDDDGEGFEQAIPLLANTERKKKIVDLATKILNEREKTEDGEWIVKDDPDFYYKAGGYVYEILVLASIDDQRERLVLDTLDMLEKMGNTYYTLINGLTFGAEDHLFKENFENLITLLNISDQDKKACLMAFTEEAMGDNQIQVFFDTPLYIGDMYFNFLNGLPNLDKMDVEERAKIEPYLEKIEDYIKNIRKVSEGEQAELLNEMKESGAAATLSNYFSGPGM